MPPTTETQRRIKDLEREVGELRRELHKFTRLVELLLAMRASVGSIALIPGTPFVTKPGVPFPITSVSPSRQEP